MQELLILSKAVARFLMMMEQIWYSSDLKKQNFLYNFYIVSLIVLVLVFVLLESVRRF